MAQIPARRQVVADSGILCPSCRKVTLLIEEPGSETPRWAHCPNCGEYIYWVGGICCVFKTSALNLTDEEQGALKKLMGPATLQPWVLEHIQETRGRLGLEEGSVDSSPAHPPYGYLVLPDLSQGIVPPPLAESPGFKYVTAPLTASALERLQAEAVKRNGPVTLWLDAHQGDVLAVAAEKGATMTEQLLGLERGHLFSWARSRKIALPRKPKT